MKRKSKSLAAETKADRAINKVVGCSLAQSMIEIDREICSTPNCQKCKVPLAKLAMLANHLKRQNSVKGRRVTVADVESDED